MERGEKSWRGEEVECGWERAISQYGDLPLAFRPVMCLGSCSSYLYLSLYFYISTGLRDCLRNSVDREALLCFCNPWSPPPSSDAVPAEALRLSY